VRTGVRPIDPTDLAGLRPEEAEAVASARRPRQEEFASGRALLRSLLDEPAPIGVLPSRAPALPDGWVGSLAHDRELAVAAVAPESSHAALGVDVEAAGTMHDDEAAIVLRADEAGLDPRLAFTLKEAAYKAWSGLGGRLLDHHDVRLDVAGGRFDASVDEGAVVLPGRYVEVAGRFLALAWAAPLTSRVVGAPVGRP
jgi:4'-phosphopantetheinyl transferase EntD